MTKNKMNNNIERWLFSRGLAFDADEEEHWITTKNGHHLLIDGEGTVKAGMGGKFNGEKIREIGSVNVGPKVKQEKEEGKLYILRQAGFYVQDKTKFMASEEERKELEVRLTSDALKRSEEVCSKIEKLGLSDEDTAYAMRLANNAITQELEAEVLDFRSKKFLETGGSVKKYGVEERIKASTQRNCAFITNAKMEGYIAFKTGKLEQSPSKIAGAVKGEPMTPEQADEKNANPEFDKWKAARTNCQTCVLAYELRLRGYDVVAKNNWAGSKLQALSKRPNEAWIDPKTGVAAGIDGMVHSPKDIKEMCNALSEKFKVGERYNMEFYWMFDGGHIIAAEKLQNGDIKFTDPQTGKVNVGAEEFDKYYHSFFMQLDEGMRYFRVDDKIPNVKIMNAVLRKGGAARSEQ